MKRVFRYFGILLAMNIMLFLLIDLFMLTEVKFDMKSNSKNLMQVFFKNSIAEQYSEVNSRSFKYHGGEVNETLIFKIPSNADVSSLRIDFGDEPSRIRVNSLTITQGLLSKIIISPKDFVSIFTTTNDITSFLNTENETIIITDGADGHIVSDSTSFTSLTKSTTSFLNILYHKELMVIFFFVNFLLFMFRFTPLYSRWTLPVLKSLKIMLLGFYKHTINFVKLYTKMCYNTWGKMNILEHFMGLIFAFYTVFAFFGASLLFAPDAVFDYSNIYVYILLSFLLYILIMPVMMNIKLKKNTESHDIVKDNSCSHRKLFLLIFIIAIFDLSLYFLIHYPAAMSYDSLRVWEEISTSTYDTVHSFLYIFIQLLLLKLWHSPAIIAITQIIFMSLMISYVSVFFYKRGLSYRKVLIGSIIFILIPINGMLSIVLWKDIPFTISLVFLGLSIAHIFDKDASLKSLMSIGVFSALVYFFRHNGVVASIFVLLLIVIVMVVKRRIKLLIPLVMFLCCYLFVTQGLYRLYSVNNAKISYFTYQNAVIISTAHLLKSEQQLPLSLKPWLDKTDPNDWRNGHLFTYPSPSPVPRGYVPPERLPTADEHKYYYFELLKHSPLLVLRTLLNFSNIVWSVTTPTGSYIMSTSLTISENPFGLIQPGATYFANIKHRLWHTVTVSPLHILFSRAGLLNVFILFAIFVFFVRKEYVKIAILLPHIANVLSLLIACMSQDYRYIYSVLPFAFIALALLFVPVKQLLRTIK